MEEYLFYLMFQGLAPVKARPIYGQSLAISIEKESGRQFYRRKLSDSITFQGDDFDAIMSHPSEKIGLEINKRNGDGWTPFWEGSFTLSDCTVNMERKTIKVTPEVEDEYTAILANIDKEYDLIKLAPAIQPIRITKRPLLQIYAAGQDTLTCLSGGLSWEIDVNEVVEDFHKLREDYFFIVHSILVEIKLTPDDASNHPGAAGVYVGRLELQDDGQVAGNLYPDTSTGYYIKGRSYGAQLLIEYIIVKDDTTPVDLYGYNGVFSELVGGSYEGDFVTLDGSPATGTVHADVKGYSVFARWLCDVESVGGTATYELPANDIVENSRHYTHVIGYDGPVATLSAGASDTPTEYGLLPDNTHYYTKPYSLGGGAIYTPILQSLWHNASVWASWGVDLTQIERKMYKEYELRDAYPIHGVLSALLAEVAPGVRFTEGGSEFLFPQTGTNPISNDDTFSLLLTPKSNLINGPYSIPAKKAPVTLGQILDMLKNVYKCYWYIEDEQLHIEHINFFERGKSYRGRNMQVGYDLSEMRTTRIGRRWDDGLLEFSTEKTDMPESYTFGWMDDVTSYFEGGEGIKVNSPLVTEGQKEETTVSQFTSDVDYMIAYPTGISQDGFALLAGRPKNSLTGGPTYIYATGAGAATMKARLEGDVAGVSAVILYVATANGGGTFSFIFYDAEGNRVAAPMQNLTADGVAHTVSQKVPAGASYISVTTSGAMAVYLRSVGLPNVLATQIETTAENGVPVDRQNALLSFTDLLPKYHRYEMPANALTVCGKMELAESLAWSRKQSVTFPAVTGEPDPIKLVNTRLGHGKIDKLTVTLSGEIAKGTIRLENLG